MAVKGVYSEAEKRMLEEWNQREDPFVGWLGNEPTNTIPYPVYHRKATQELIENMAYAMDFPNPLWRDDKYASTTRWGGIIAPPFYEQIRAILAGSLTPEGKVMESGRFTIQPSTAVNTVMVTFDFTPQVVLVEIEAALVILEKNSNRTFSVGGGRYNVVLELRNNQIILRGNSNLTSNAAVLYITWP